MKQKFILFTLLCLVVAFIFATASCSKTPNTLQDGTTTITTTPEQTTPESTTPEETTPEQTTPEQTTPEETTPEETTPEQSTPEEEPVPEEPVAVDSLNGMNAAQLYEKFENDYKNSTSYEIQYDWTQSDEWWASSSSQTLKVNGNDFYYLIKGRYNETIEAWAIGDVAYVNRSDWEIKCARDNVDDVFGKGFLASLSPTLIQEASASYYAGLAEAQLYLKDGVYFCTVSYFATEESTKQTTQTVFFDENGKLTKIVSDVNYPHLKIVVNYTAPVEVLLPEDALGYYEVPDIPKTEEEMYQLYVDACANLKNSQFLRANIDIPGVDYIDYKRYRENKHIRISINSTSTAYWIFNKKGYTKIHWDKPTQTPIDDAFLSEFTAIENLFPLVPFEKEGLKNFDCYYNLYTFETTIIFEQVDESGKLLQYEYTISNDRDRLDVEITELENGKRVETYLFNFEIDPENKINDPTK